MFATLLFALTAIGDPTMNLGEIRQIVVDQTGRYDLAVDPLDNDYSDRGCNVYINKGLRTLDRLFPEVRREQRYSFTLAQGEFQKQVPGVRVAKRAFLQKTDLYEKLDRVELQDLIADYNVPFNEVSEGVPAKWARGKVQAGLYLIDVSFKTGNTPVTLNIDPNEAEDWHEEHPNEWGAVGSTATLDNNGINVLPGANDSDQFIMIRYSDAAVSGSFIIDIDITVTHGSLYLALLDDNFVRIQDPILLESGLNEITPVSSWRSIAFVAMNLADPAHPETPVPPSGESITNVTATIKSVVLRLFDTADGWVTSSLSVPWFTFMPPADQSYTVILEGLFTESLLSSDTDTNFWTDDQRYDLLVDATIYELEKAHTNASRASAMLNAIKEQGRELLADVYDDDIDDDEPFCVEG